MELVVWAGFGTVVVVGHVARFFVWVYEEALPWLLR